MRAGIAQDLDPFCRRQVFAGVTGPGKYDYDNDNDNDNDYCNDNDCGNGYPLLREERHFPDKCSWRGCRPYKIKMFSSATFSLTNTPIAHSPSPIAYNPSPITYCTDSASARPISKAFRFISMKASGIRAWSTFRMDSVETSFVIPTTAPSMQMLKTMGFPICSITA